VTKDLAAALRHLRYEDKVRVPWIDAICVDQENLQERSQQVERMADLYTMAGRVVVWLGPERANSTSALCLLETLISKIEADWDTCTLKPASEEEHDQHWADKAQMLPYEAEEQGWLDDLLGRSWFETLWIWQEIILANEHAIIICGRATMPWRQFRDAILCLKMKSLKPTVMSRKLSLRIDSVFVLCSEKGSSKFDSLVAKTSYCKYTDPRDRVFALLSMLSKSEKDVEIKPDYTKTKGEVYKDVVSRFLESFQVLQILSSCEMRDKPSDCFMPTWVPDWSVANEAGALMHFRSSGDALSEAQYIDGGILQVTGVRLAVIKAVYNFTLVDDSWEERIKVVRDLIPLVVTDANSPYRGGGTLFEAFCRTIHGGLFDKDFLLANPLHVTFEQCKNTILTILGRGTVFSETLEVIKSCVNRIAKTLWGRCFYVTEEGYVGVGAKINCSRRRSCSIARMPSEPNLTACSSCAPSGYWQRLH
jgi:hypothetical protein